MPDQDDIEELARGRTWVEPAGIRSPPGSAFGGGSGGSVRNRPAARRAFALGPWSGYLEGAPDLVAEVAANGVSIDMHGKLHACRRNGVQEYIVWMTRESVSSGASWRTASTARCPAMAEESSTAGGSRDCASLPARC